MYECLTDLLLVFAESAMSLFAVASVAPFSNLYPVDFRLRTLHIHPMGSHSFMMTALDQRVNL